MEKEQIYYKTLVKINEIIVGTLQSIIHGETEEYKKEIENDLKKIIDLILFLHKNRIMKDYEGEYFSIEGLKDEIKRELNVKYF